MTYAERKAKARNPESFLAYRRGTAARYRAAHPEKMRLANRKAYIADVGRRREYSRNWAKAHPDEVRQMKQDQYDRRKAIIIAAKDKPCTDCGIKYPHYVMDLDHVRGTKVMAVSSFLGRRLGETKLLAEIAKCEVVCSNCHRERTYARLQRT